MYDDFWQSDENNNKQILSVCKKKTKTAIISEHNTDSHRDWAQNTNENSWKIQHVFHNDSTIEQWICLLQIARTYTSTLVAFRKNVQILISGSPPDDALLSNSPISIVIFGLVDDRSHRESNSDSRRTNRPVWHNVLPNKRPETRRKWSAV